MFQFPRFPPARLWIHRAVHEVCSCGFPHSDIRGSGLMCSSPRLFAAYRVLHRLPVPRHPPCALLHLTMRLLPPAMTCSFLESVLRCFLARTSSVSPDRPPVFPGRHLIPLPLDNSSKCLPILRVHTDGLPFRRARGFRSSLQHVTARFVYAVFKVRTQLPAAPNTFFDSGGHLLSRTVSSEVPSAAWVLTVVFGMGTGVSPTRIAARSLRALIPGQ